MQTADVTVVVNGAPYTKWEDITVTGGVGETAMSFSLVIAAIGGGTAAASVFALFAPVQIFESGEMIFNGYVDRRHPHITKDSFVIEVSGRGKGQDACDCSCIHPTGRFDNQTPLQIAQALDQFGIGFTSDVSLEQVPEYQLQPGSSLFREIEKMCRDQGATLSGQRNGSIKLTKAGQTARRQAGELIEGENMQVIEGDFNAQNLHSEIRLRGQSYDGSGPDHLQIEAIAQNSAVPRYRPLVLIQDANTDKTRAQGRAANRRDKAAGDGIRASVVVAGWRDDDDELYEHGNIVWISTPSIALEQDMLIETVHYRQTGKGGDGDNAGSTGLLELVDPRAHGGQGSQAGQSGAAWNFDSAAASIG